MKSKNLQMDVLPADLNAAFKRTAAPFLSPSEPNSLSCNGPTLLMARTSSSVFGPGTNCACMAADKACSPEPKDVKKKKKECVSLYQ